MKKVYLLVSAVSFGSLAFGQQTLIRNAQRQEAQQILSQSENSIEKAPVHAFTKAPGDVLFSCSVDCSANMKDSADTLLIDVISVNNDIIINTISTSSTNAFMSADYNKTYSVYGTPELTEKGQSFTTYNDDPNYRYTNSFQSIYTDGDSSWDNPGIYGRRIISSNSENNRCVTFVTGPKDINTPNDSFVRHYNRNSLEDLFTMADGEVSGENNLLKLNPS